MRKSNTRNLVLTKSKESSNLLTKKSSTDKPRSAEFKTLDNLSRAAKALFPEALLTQDRDGEIIILTGYKETTNGRVRRYDPK